MTTDQKVQAMQALVPFIDHVSVTMRAPGNWFCTVKGVEVKKGATLESPTSRSANPERAIDDMWNQLTILGQEQYLVIDAMKDSRRAVRWNGFMWADIRER